MNEGVARAQTPAPHDPSILRPVRVPSVSAFALDDEVVLYEPSGGATYVLNPTARLIWSLCDGERTLQEVAEEVADAYAIDEQRALADVTALLETLESAGYIATVDAA